tara:strand:+ start:7316 stop:7621 length:306 start_codon:yes stop_codon:yes gene_type:complete
MNFEEFSASVETEPSPPEGLSPELRALWLAKNDQWHESHEVVNDIHSKMGSWIHAHLHLIEGDTGNAAYWYHRANVPAKRDPSEIPAEWEELVKANLGSQG